MDHRRTIKIRSHRSGRSGVGWWRPWLGGGERRRVLVREWKHWCPALFQFYFFVTSVYIISFDNWFLIRWRRTMVTDCGLSEGSDDFTQWVLSLCIFLVFFFSYYYINLENCEVNLLAHYFLFSIIISCFEEMEKIRGTWWLPVVLVSFQLCSSQSDRGFRFVLGDESGWKTQSGLTWSYIFRE